MTGGRVFLVGAGPGAPGLITVRGMECLAAADLVLYDGLVNPLLLRHVRDGCRCERTARTRREDSLIVEQSEINTRMIREATSGKTVVRLKGGDPYIFGRGSEEAAALSAAGVAYEVVPGVTAATAAGEYAGFSYTHRSISAAVAFITGHEDSSRGASKLDYAALAAFPGTLVFYMGLNRLQEICERLTAHGMGEDTPAAVVCQASLPSQKVVEGTVSTLPAAAIAAGLRPPSLIVIGHCIRQRAHLNWFEHLPLFGLSVGVTRAADQSEEIVNQILRLGGEPVLMPMIQTSPVDEVQAAAIHQEVANLSQNEWIIFTSVNGVSEFFRHLHLSARDTRALGRCRIAAIGSVTAGRLEDFGVIPDVTLESSGAEQLAEHFLSERPTGAVLWIRGSRARDVLPSRLSTAGIVLRQLIVYESNDTEAFPADVVARLRQGTLHWIGLSSPAIARRVAELLKPEGLLQRGSTTRFASISPVTTQVAIASGLTVHAEAKMASWDGILQEISRAGSAVP